MCFEDSRGALALVTESRVAGTGMTRARSELEHTWSHGRELMGGILATPLALLFAPHQLPQIPGIYGGEESKLPATVALMHWVVRIQGRQRPEEND